MWVKLSAVVDVSVWCAGSETMFPAGSMVPRRFKNPCRIYLLLKIRNRGGQERCARMTPRSTSAVLPRLKGPHAAAPWSLLAVAEPTVHEPTTSRRFIDTAAVWRVLRAGVMHGAARLRGCWPAAQPLQPAAPLQLHPWLQPDAVLDAPAVDRFHRHLRAGWIPTGWAVRSVVVPSVAVVGNRWRLVPMGREDRVTADTPGRCWSGSCRQARASVSSTACPNTRCSTYVA